MYQVQKIIESRVDRKGRRQYYVKWVGYGSDENTWEPERNLENAKDVIREYWRDMKSLRGREQEQEEKERGNGSVKREARSEKQGQDEKDEEKEGQNISKQKNSSRSKNNPRKSPVQYIDLCSQSSQPFPSPQLQKQHQQILQSPKKPPKAEKMIKKKPKPSLDLLILGMSRDQKENKYVYLVRMGGENRWVDRSYLEPKYLKELCDFYEENISFI